MAKQRRVDSGLEGIAGAAQREARRGPPPVHLWNPPFCGDLDMRIASDGTWYYLGTPIGRPALVRLFASILKRENGRYFLVTPVEKVGIIVEDAPLLAVELRIEDAAPAPVLNFRTNVDDWVVCDVDHALRFEPEHNTGGLKPYLHVRRDLWAKVSRPLFYDLVARGEERVIEGARMFGVASGAEFFVMAPADSLKDFACWTAARNSPARTPRRRIFFRAPRRASRSMSRADLPIRTSSPSAAITTPIR